MTETEKDALELAQHTLINAIVYITLTSHYIKGNKQMERCQIDIIRDISETTEKIANVLKRLSKKENLKRGRPRDTERDKSIDDCYHQGMSVKETFGKLTADNIEVSEKTIQRRYKVLKENNGKIPTA